MTWLALPWFVLVTSGSATRMSAVVGAELIGLAALGIPGGAVLRRLGAWRTMVLSDAIRAPLMLAIPVLHWAGVDAFAAILVLAFLLGALAGPFFAAQKVIVPELLGENEALVGRANALFQGATRITMLLGPVLGGILIAAVSAPWALVVDGCTYVVSALLVLTLVPRPAALPPADEDVGARRGLRFLRVSRSYGSGSRCSRSATRPGRRSSSASRSSSSPGSTRIRTSPAGCWPRSASVPWPGTWLRTSSCSSASAA